MAALRNMYLIVAVALQLMLLMSGGVASNNTRNCKLTSELDKERAALKLLEPLTDKTFTVEEKVGSDNYTYQFQVCGDVQGMKGGGLVQIDGKKKKVLIGSYNATQAIAGTDWVLLIYGLGEPYDQHCNKEHRRALIMISCDRNAVPASNLKVVLENRDRSEDCFYLFELDSSAVCPVLPSKLSAGSVLLIIAFCCLAVYLIGGFLYMRLVVGAKGVEQFPHYAFWSEIGNLSADGCDFVCRSRSNRQEPPTYTGVATEPLGEEPEERDDHLLPM